MKPFPITLAALAVGYMIAAGVHDLGARPSYTQEMKDDYENCKLGGATVQQCNNMIKIWADAMTPPENATDKCDAARLAAERTCVDGHEDNSYDGGDVTYRPADRAREIPLCERIGSAAYHACHNY